MNKHPAEFLQVAAGFLPVLMNTNPGPTADWFSLKNYNGVCFIFAKGVGTAGDDPVLTLLQAQAVAGTNPKALNITRIDKKQAATNLFAVGAYTKSTSDTPATHDTFNANTWTNTDLAEQAAIVLVYVKAEDLDADNGYDCVQLGVGDVGTNAQLGCLLAVGIDAKNEKETLDSMIID